MRLGGPFRVACCGSLPGRGYRRDGSGPGHRPALNAGRRAWRPRSACSLYARDPCWRAFAARTCLRQPFDFRAGRGVAAVSASGVMRSSARRAARAALATGLPIAAFTKSEMAIMHSRPRLAGGGACHPTGRQRSALRAVAATVLPFQSERPPRDEATDAPEVCCRSTVAVAMLAEATAGSGGKRLYRA